MVRRSLTLTPEQDAFVEQQRQVRGWTRSLWFQELLKRQMGAADFVVPANMTDSGRINHRESEASR
jgi:hypothetical protein